jgi:hypothetical protein
MLNNIKNVLKKHVKAVLIGFIWLRIKTSNGFLCTGLRPGNFSLAVRVLPFQGLFSMDLDEASDEMLGRVFCNTEHVSLISGRVRFVVVYRRFAMLQCSESGPHSFASSRRPRATTCKGTSRDVHNGTNSSIS